jgi:type IV pilus assembly protein PilA
MTEYIITVALIAIAAIGVYTLFGNVVKTQTGSIAQALAGDNGNALKSNEKASKLSKDESARVTERKALEVIPPISIEPKSRTVMQPWPDAALG